MSTRETRASGYREQSMPALRSDLNILSVSPDAGCRVVDGVSGVHYDFGKKEAFLLRRLGSGASPRQLAEDFSRHFGQDCSAEDIVAFLQLLQSWDLLVGSVPPAAGPVEEENDSAYLWRPNRFHLFNPQKLLDVLLDLLQPLRFVFPVLAGLLFVVGCIMALRHYDSLASAITSSFKEYGVVGKLLVTTATVNLASQVARGLVARHFCMATPSFGIWLELGLVPRFNLQIIPGRHITRKTRLWLSATSTLVRISMFGGGVLLWHMAIYSRGLSSFAALVSFIAFVGLAFSANPFWRSDGVNFFSALLRIPDLRERSHRMFWSLFSRKPPAVARHTTRRLGGMALFGMCSIFFLYAVFGYVAYSVFRALEKSFQGAGVALALMLFGYIGFSMSRAHKAKKAGKGRMKQGA